MVFRGKGVCGGIAMGQVSVLMEGKLPVEKRHVEDVQKEKERFREACGQTEEVLERIYEQALSETGEENAAIFKAHQRMLQDEVFEKEVMLMIETQQVNAEAAVSAVAGKFEEMFVRMEDEQMRERAADVKDVTERLIKCLKIEAKVKPVEAAISLSVQRIICADDLTPSQTVRLDRQAVLAFVTASGSPYSHTAILAKSRGIPAIVDIGADFLENVKDGDFLIVDGNKGEVILRPDEETIRRYEQRKQQPGQPSKQWEESEATGMADTRVDDLPDRQVIPAVFANISEPEEVGEAIQNGAEGIGLFRSEFLYLKNVDYPSEEEQFLAYRKVLEAMGNRKVIIRTMDIGADKQIPFLSLKKEQNPALGLRGLRLSLARPDLFKTQLRALFRASVYGRLGIMFPMVTSVEEVKKALMICEEVKNQLTEEGKAFDHKTETGIMIETPAAAVASDSLAELVDFFSIGTNDLMQYTFACDRQSADFCRYTQEAMEAVFRLMEQTVRNAHLKGIPVGICGELAADTALTPLFCQMGIDELSVSPSRIAEIQKKESERA